MKTIIQKPDLDTCMAGLVLGVTRRDMVVVTPEQASFEDIMNPGVICIEAGGSGWVHLNDFDHHDEGYALPSACVQAISARGIQDDYLDKLAQYIEAVDTGQMNVTVDFPSLSNVFSGIRLVESRILKQFFKGIDLLAHMVEHCIDPFAPLEIQEGWDEYIEAKQRNLEKVMQELKNAAFLTGRTAKIGVCVQTGVGGFGGLFSEGCDIAILYNPSTGEDTGAKCTIASRGRDLFPFVAKLNAMETGWGGRKNIIGSPRGRGTSLDISIISELAKQFF
ncbi:MAG: hypothetical protein K9K63_18765 [Desulfotignum sp.]|nr:hypothetical protein [Desulfotignum sp.]MCF8089614.1 hypothetical protein [Desulfotignum sp.]MCF8139344.1 hypothetical protein [Desulfotignum sp.]